MKSEVVALFLLMCFPACSASEGTPAVPSGDGGVAYRSPIRSESRINADWYYCEADDVDPSNPSRAATEWVAITLPHTWNVTDVVDPVPGYRRSISWYRKDLVLPVIRDPARFLLSFEGVNITCEIYVNGAKAGSHVGGYVGFDVDITPFVHAGETNTLLVRVSNAYNPDVIPSQKSDFCIYGGITRDVWLRIVPDTYIEAVRLQTPDVSELSAAVVANISIRTYAVRGIQLDAECVILDPKGDEVLHAGAVLDLRDEQSLFTLTLPPLANPDLWSTDHPALYTIKVRLQQGDAIIDELDERFGLRWFEFREHGPFFLNGKRLLLRGTHRHEDYAGWSNAMPDSLHRLDMRMIKEMGANFVRLAHYPQDPEVYRACDELGLLVWDELPWCRGGTGGDAWKANTRRLLREQIERYYNHPSIIIRSLGNEMYWLPDFERGDAIDSLRAMVKELNDLAHRLDPGRVTATRKFTEGADLVDVVSPSLWPGWYSGYYKGFQSAYEEARTNFSRFFHAEYGGDSHVGRHTENPVSGEGAEFGEGWEENIKPQKVMNVAQSGDWSESYIVDLFDWALHVSEQLDWLPGNAQWAFKDFPTPLRPDNPLPYMNQKGLLDRAGKPKDAYYVFKSYWTDSPLFCYIESHTWTERSGPAGLPRTVCVFSNCDEVELLLNGSLLGRRSRNIREYPACGLTWPVRFVEGNNVLTAVGYHKGARVTADSVKLTYSYRKNGVADHLELTADRRPDGTVLVTATAVDRDGRRCLDYNKRVYFSSDGPGRLLVDEGTPTRSSILEMANGVAQVEFVPATGGKAVVEARNQDFKGAFVILGN